MKSDEDSDQAKVLASSRRPAKGARNSINFFKVESVGKRRSCKISSGEK